ncbi:MAG: amidohydrolase [Vicinamibacteria bacterium]|nr:amidohydrolase [Vicinamibacteria bacterium]
MFRSRLWWLVLTASAFTVGGSGAEPPPADRVFVGGRIWTGEPGRPRAEALAVRGDRLAAVGTDAEVRALVGPATEVVLLRGAFVAPGFNDAHLHFLVVPTVELDQVWEVALIQRRIREYAAANPASPWVTGRGWFYGAFPGGLPDKALLDAAVADRPAFMTGYDGHTGWANSKALALAGITRDTPDPRDGVIVRDAFGEPTGVLKEAAMGLVRKQIPRPTDDELYRALKLRLDQAASYGLTSIQNASSIELPVYERVMNEGGLKVRVTAALPFQKDPTAEEVARYEELRRRHRGPLLRFGILKGMLDGVVESKTAAMFDEYTTGGGHGHLNWSDEDLKAAAAFWDARGWQIQLHAIGDRAIDQALSAIEHAAKVNGTSGRRHRVEHVEAPRAADVARFVKAGAIASTQALFANPDKNTLEVYAANLGPDRSSRAMAFRMFDAAGVPQPFGSDWPVFPMEVRLGLYAAVTRTTPEGVPPGGWEPHLTVSAEAALRHFTVDGAYASFEEDIKGTLAVGKLADFVVLSEDVTQPPARRILDAKVLRTVMGGKDTFRAAP